MKLKQEFLTPESGGAAVRSIYNQLIRNSSMGCVIVGCLSEDTTEAAIIEQLRAMYDVPGAEVEAGVARVLAKLREVGALEE